MHLCTAHRHDTKTEYSYWQTLNYRQFSSTCMVKHSIRTVNHRGNCASQVDYSIPHLDKCSILIDDRLYSAIRRSLEQTHCARMWFYMGDLLYIHRSGVLTALAWLVPHDTTAISAQVLCTPYNHIPCHFMRNHIDK